MLSFLLFNVEMSSKGMSLCSKVVNFLCVDVLGMIVRWAVRNHA